MGYVGSVGLGMAEGGDVHERGKRACVGLLRVYLSNVSVLCCVKPNVLCGIF